MSIVTYATVAVAANRMDQMSSMLLSAVVFKLNCSASYVSHYASLGNFIHPKRRFWKAGQTFPRAFAKESDFENALGKVCPAFQNLRLGWIKLHFAVSGTAMPLQCLHSGAIVYTLDALKSPLGIDDITTGPWHITPICLVDSPCRQGCLESMLPSMALRIAKRRTSSHSHLPAC